MYAKHIKRIFDFVLSLFAVIVLSPLLLFLAVLVRLKLGSPVIFKQQRPGRIDKKTGKEKIFTLYKFRTMTNGRDEAGELLPDTERLTKFGKALRSTSLDELPELLNILKGDMSVVGPRPLLVKYLPLYSKEQHHRHDVRPGLTGYAQINGRNAVTWEDKFLMDVKYASQLSFLWDVSIIFGTVKAVLSHRGITSETSVTMEEFKGYSDAVSLNEEAKEEK